MRSPLTIVYSPPKEVRVKECLQDYEGEVIIPASVTSIGEYAFWHCAKISSVKIPEGVRRIERMAFCGCEGLTSVEIPSTVEYIGRMAFYECVQLKHITMPSNRMIMPINSDSYLLMYDTALHIDYRPDAKPLAFSVELPVMPSYCWQQNRVVQWQDYGDGWFKSKEPINLPWVSAYKDHPYIGDDYEPGFSNAELSSRDVDSDRYCAWLSQWMQCPCEISRGYLMAKIDDIPAWIQRVSARHSRPTIDPHPFIGIGSLIFSTASWTDTNLRSLIYCSNSVNGKIVIPDFTTKIDDYVFYQHTGLTSVEIPDSVTQIGIQAFGDCSSLREIYCMRRDIDSCTIDKSAFKGVNPLLCRLYVPKHSVWTYRRQSCFRKFLQIYALSKKDYAQRMKAAAIHQVASILLGTDEAAEGVTIEFR